MAGLLSVNVGLPRDIEWQGKTVHTAVWKTPVQGRRTTRRLNIDGNGQADLAGHGGEQGQCLSIRLNSYRYWQNQLGRNDFTYGQFGRILQSRDWRILRCALAIIIGSAMPSSKSRSRASPAIGVGIRMNEPQMAALLVSHRRPGFYFRVLEECEVCAGDDIVKVKAGPERVTSPRSTRCCICRVTRRAPWNVHCAYRH
jgi:MOSC domain-containing protein YiiM